MKAQVERPSSQLATPASSDGQAGLFKVEGKAKTQLEQQLVISLVSDLVKIGWKLSSRKKGLIELLPPVEYEKHVVQKAMSHARKEILKANGPWIKKHIKVARQNLAEGHKVIGSPILPRIEVCENQKQHDLFRMFRYYWSSPFSDYVGRRVKLLVRDDGVEGSPLIGIAALGSSIIHIPERDNWIGWDTATRTQRIIYMMDAYVLGALPPYNELLGGKLVSYILASNEVRAILKKKYKSAQTLIKKRKASEVVLVVTTSLYGNSSQYNRLKYGKKLLYQPIGSTSGYGSLHISSKTFGLMRKLVKRKHLEITNKFGDGPNWRMRVIRSACDIIGIDSDVILRHSFRRGIYASPLATNWKSFLKGETRKPKYRDIPLEKVVQHWKERWLDMRKQNELVLQKVKNFSPKQFKL
jgi:hypothetical protein